MGQSGRKGINFKKTLWESSTNLYMFLRGVLLTFYCLLGGYIAGVDIRNANSVGGLTPKSISVVWP